MSIGQVIVTQLNMQQGEPVEAERVFLYIGKAANPDNLHKILSIGADSDLDELLGSGDSDLKTHISAAVLNAATDSFYCYAIPIDPATDDWVKVLDTAMDKPFDLQVEAVVLTTEITDANEIKSAQAAMISTMTSYGKYLTAQMCCSGIDKATETWADYAARIKALITGQVADRVAVVPNLHGNNLGVVCGRLCNPAVTVADTPMRVATGALINLGDDPVDKNGIELSMADISDMSNARFSVPQWYAGYAGTYWADQMLLDTETGDFQVYENRRVLDYLARRVRLRAIARIADRYLNSTPKSIANNKTYFMTPMRVAAQPIIIGPLEFPGIIQPPKEGDLTITWKSRTEVVIGFCAAPHDCPKKIWIYMALDLTRYQSDESTQSVGKVKLSFKKPAKETSNKKK